MGLIKCSECDKEVSEKAPSCPFCGNPIANSPVLIEQTAKKWKLVRLISWIMILGGVFLFLKGLGSGGMNSPSLWMGICIGFFGIVGNLIGKLGSWWHHR